MGSQPALELARFVMPKFLEIERTLAKFSYQLRSVAIFHGCYGHGKNASTAVLVISNDDLEVNAQTSVTCKRFRMESSERAKMPSQGPNIAHDPQVNDHQPSTPE